ncbi:PAS domain S-box protein [Phormidium nigroviride]
MSFPLNYDPSLDRPIDESDPAQQSLRDRQLRALFETTLDAIAIADDGGRYVDLNPAACELLGLEKNEILGRCISDFLEPGFNFQALWQQFQQQEKVRGEIRLVRPDGDTRIVEYAATANFLPHRHLSVMRDITQSKRAESQVRELTRKLEQTQAQLRENGIDSANISTPAEYHRLEQIARHIPGVIYQFRQRPDGTFHFPYSSDGIREIYGVSPEEVTDDASKAFGAIHPEDIDSVNQSILESAEHLTPWYCEYRSCLPDGRMLWLVGNATPEREADGSTLWHGYIRDITDSKSREIALHESETKFSTIFHTSPDPAWIATLREGRCLNVNESLCELLERTHTDIIGKTCVEIELWDDLKDLHHFRHTLIRERRIQNFEVVIRTSSRQAKTVLISATVERLDGQDCVIGMIKDISDRKAAEKNLRQNEQKYHQILDAITDMVLVKGPQSRIVWANKAFRDYYGLTNEQLKDMIDAPFNEPDYTLQYIRDDAYVFETGKSLEIEEPVTRYDGKVQMFNTIKSVIRNEVGETILTVGVSRNITDRKQADIENWQMQNFLNSIVENIPHMLFVKDADTLQFLRFNKAGEELLGYPKEALLGKSDYDFFPPAEADFFIAKDRETLSNGNVLDIPEEQVQTNHQGTRILHTRKIPILDEVGNPKYLLGISEDITERKQAEIELASSQAELMALFNAIQDVIIVLNAEGRYLKIAPSSAPLLYQPSQEILGKTLHELLPKDTADLFLNTIHQAIINQSLMQLEYSLPIEDRLIWFDGRISPMSEDRVVLVARDISERKRQEQSLRLIVEGTAAKTGEEFFRTCVQYIAQVLEVRYAFIAEFIDSEKLSAKTLAFWAVDDFGDNFTYNLAGAPCENVYSQGDFCLYRNSVQLLFPEDTDLVALQAESYAGLPIMDAAGNPLGLLAVLDTKPMVQDIEMQSAILRIFATRAGAEIERIKAEAAVRQSEIQLRLQSEELTTTLKKLQNTQTQLIQAEKMSSLGQLVAGIAHEINNPVSFIYGNLQPAADYASYLIELVRLYQHHYPSPSPTISKFIEDIELEYLVSDFSNLLESMKTGATRISDIVKSLRTFSRLDEAELKPIDIHENIESTLIILQNRLNRSAEQKEISVVKNYGTLPLIECYGGLLNQVFLNLLVNAVDAIEQKQESLESVEKVDYVPKITITTSIVSTNQLSISIQDNGCGMSSQVQEKIFNPFFTTKPVGKGTGMGLATSYQIVTDNHQGNLRCCSTLGKGTKFRIELPISEQN